MILKEMYTFYVDALCAVYEKGEAEAITKIALEHFTKIDITKIILHTNENIEEKILQNLNLALSRLLTHEPIQYITGNTWFYNLNFKVNKNVLIPRPETEELVFEVIKNIKQNNFKKIIDIGTGSGCIPISIKKNIEEVVVTAIDVSEEALNIAKENALINNVEINYKRINFLDEQQHIQFEKFDIIISNPPYIPQNEKEILNKNVTEFEPSLALFVPQNDALIFYKKILLFANNHLENNGFVFLEVHENLAKETAQIFTNEKYNVIIKKDMQEKERMLIINRCQ